VPARLDRVTVRTPHGTKVTLSWQARDQLLAALRPLDMMKHLVDSFDGAGSTSDVVVPPGLSDPPLDVVVPPGLSDPPLDVLDMMIAEAGGIANLDETLDTLRLALRGVSP
jgi:hypothetical protein